MSTGTVTAANLQDLVGDQIQDRFNVSKWNTVASITDGRPGRVWVLYTDGRCIIEDVADLADLVDYEAAA